jgi:hypothetical protein
MLPARIDPGQVIVEVPHLGRARPPWRWFELDLDHAPRRDLRAGLRGDMAAHPVRVSGMTRHHQPDPIGRRITRGAALTHIQFEACHPAAARRAARLITEAGLTPLPAIHLPQSPGSADDLRRLAGILADLDAPLVKLAYPAPDPVRVRWGTELLTSWDHPGTALAVIPMGTTSGRAAALAAGSALIWAPLRGDGERWGASQLLPLLAGRATAFPHQGDRHDAAQL